LIGERHSWGICVRRRANLLELHWHKMIYDFVLGSCLIMIVKSVDVASAAFGWIAEDPLSLRRPNTFEVMRQLAERDGLVQNGD
jgi:hypothetical protein